MIKVILIDGSETTLAEWQKIYGLPIGSDNIGRHFSLHDAKIAQNLHDHGYLTIVAPLIMVADLAREKDGSAWIINAFNRTEADQKRLQDDPRYAAASVSPHVVSMAMDIGCSKFVTVNGITSFSPIQSKQEVFNKVQCLKDAAHELGLKIRIGFQQYLNLPTPMYFVHFDVCPEYYPVGKPYHSHTHPIPWENEITW